MIMRKIIKQYYNIFNNYKDEKVILHYLRKVQKIWKTLSIIPLKKTLVLSTICSKYKNEDE